MTPEAQLTSVAAVSFFAALTRSTFGFGEALVAMPLLALLVDIQTASALIAINSIANSLLILATARETTDWRGGWRLIVSSLVGIPVGVFLLTHVPDLFVKRLLTAVLIGFSLYNLMRVNRWRLTHDNWAFPFGFFGGVLGGAYNTAGPPLVIFGALRGWTPEQFRSTLQGVFLSNAMMVLATHCCAGLWSNEVLRYIGWTIPLVAITVPLGYFMNRRIHPEHFHRALYVILLLLGVMLAWSTVQDSALPQPATPAKAVSNAGTQTNHAPVVRCSPSASLPA